MVYDEETACAETVVSDDSHNEEDFLSTKNKISGKDKNGEKIEQKKQDTIEQTHHIKQYNYQNKEHCFKTQDYLNDVDLHTKSNRGPVMVGYHDDMNRLIHKDSHRIKIRQKLACIVSSLFFFLVITGAFLWGYQLGKNEQSLASIIFGDTNLVNGNFQEMQTENIQLNTTIDELITSNEILSEKVNNYTNLNEALSKNISTCTSNYMELKDTIQHLEDELEEERRQCGELTQHNGELKVTVGSLQDEIIILDTLNDNLKESIDNLETQSNNFSDQNEALNTTVEELRNNAKDLEDNNDRYKELNNQFNSSISKLSNENLRLENQISIYTKLNEDLNVTAAQLETDVGRLETDVDELQNLNDRLESSIDKLAKEMENLQDSNGQLEVFINELKEQTSQLSDENIKSQISIEKLELIVGFLNNPTQNTDETYEDMTAFLAEQISSYQGLVLEGLKNTYHQRITSWDCNFVDRFGLEEFSSNENLVIPQSSSSDVFEYINKRVLDDLCLFPYDFKRFVYDSYANQFNYSNSEDITTRVLAPSITTKQLFTAVQVYTWDALEYYFTGNIKTSLHGLTYEDWSRAGYDCNELPIARRFVKYAW